MGSAVRRVLILAVGWAVLAPAVLADEHLSGKVSTSFESTHPITALLYPSIGPFPSPSAVSSQEVTEALNEFKSRTLAIRQIENLKRKAGISKEKGGILFARFSYPSTDTTPTPIYGALKCGISSASAGSIEQIVSQSVHTAHLSVSEFRQMKRMTRTERVRAIAACLSQLPGMPPLASRTTQFKTLRINRDFYLWVEDWLKTRYPALTRVSVSKIRRMTDCLVTRTAQNLPDPISGEHIVALALNERVREDFSRWMAYVTVVRKEEVDDFYSAESFAERGKSGLSTRGWGTEGVQNEFGSHAIEQVLHFGLPSLQECATRAKISFSQSGALSSQLTHDPAQVAGAPKQ